MKNAPDRKTAIESDAVAGAPIIAPGGYPKKLHGASAEILARLLAGEVLTAADTLDGCGTMRAAAHVHYLSDTYGWSIERDERATGCTDGRVVTVTTYSLPQSTIAQARAAGAAEWCNKVREARAALRAKDLEAYRRAAAMNKASRARKPSSPGQGDLFE